MKKNSIKKILVYAYSFLVALLLFFIIKNQEYLTLDNLNFFFEKYISFRNSINENKLFFSLLFLIVSVLFICLLGIISPVLVISTIMFGYLGGFLSIISATIGSTLSFLFAKQFQQSIENSFKNISIKKNSFFLYVIFRFIPGVPFIIKNFSGVFFSLSIRNFIIATLIAESPQILLFTYVFSKLLESSEILINNFDISIVYEQLATPILLMFIFVIFLFVIKIKFQKSFFKN